MEKQLDKEELLRSVLNKIVKEDPKLAVNMMMEANRELEKFKNTCMCDQCICNQTGKEF